MRLLVTGATGFVGRVLVARAQAAGWEVRAAVRSATDVTRRLLPGVELAEVGDLALQPDFGAALAGVDAVAHLAARVHVMHETAVDPEAAFRRMNVEVPLRLAEAAARAGVPRLVHLSSIKVNGERTTTRPFTAADAPAPADPYGRSKLEAETALTAWARRSGATVIILRPPLVHGPGAKGNLQRILGWLARGIPLPLASIRNRRSLVGVANLADAILAGAVPAAPGGTYLVADPEPLSTPALLQLLGEGLGRPARLVPCPVRGLRLLGSLAGKGEEVRRLTESLEVDATATQAALDWTPALPAAEGLRAMARAYRDLHPN